MQFTADITGTELVVSQVAESSALGAALAGLVGLGHLKSLQDVAALPRATRVYRPTMSRDQVERLCAGWRAAVERVL